MGNQDLLVRLNWTAPTKSGKHETANQDQMTTNGGEISAPKPIPIANINQSDLEDHEMFKDLTCVLDQHQEHHVNSTFNQHPNGTSTANQTAQDRMNKNAEQRALHACEWLTSIYEPQENVSMPRSVLYDHYLEASAVTGHEPVNSATFGKLLRAVFPTLRTRRLGTRGNSKYHYYGIGIRADRVNKVPPQFSCQIRTTPPGSVKQSYGTKKKLRISTVMRKYNNNGDAIEGEGIDGNVDEEEDDGQDDSVPNSPLMTKKLKASTSASSSSSSSHGTQPKHRKERQRLLPNAFHDIHDFSKYLEQLCMPNPASSLPMHISYESLQSFASAYYRLLMEKIEMISTLQFHKVHHH